MSHTWISLLISMLLVEVSPVIANQSVTIVDREIKGEWETVPLPGAENLMQAVHSVLLPNGKVLLANGSSFRNTILKDGDKVSIQEGVLSSDYATINNTALFNPETGAFQRIASPPAIQHGENNDLFCAGHLHLADGNVLFIGGTDRYYPGGKFTGSRQVNLYNWRENKWSDLGQIKEGRWYPSLIPLADGKIAIFSGLKRLEPNQINPSMEIYDPRQNKFAYFDLSQTPNSPFNTKLENSDKYDSIDLYPRIFPTADGKLLITGDEAGIANVLVPHISTKTYLLSITQSQDKAPEISFAAGPEKTETSKAYGTAFQAPNSEDVVLLGGLTKTNDIGFGLLNNTSGMPEASVASSLQRWSAPGKDTGKIGKWQTFKTFLGKSRANQQAVILPDKEILVVNGGVYPEYTPVFEPQLLSPDSQANGGYKITAMNPAKLPRLYHNGALLLPDARVLVIGGNANRAAREENGTVHVDTVRDKVVFNKIAKLNDMAGQPKQFSIVEYFKNPQSYYAEGDKQPFVPAEMWQAEVFSPPYLFKPGPRPEISAAPKSLRYGQSDAITVTHPGKSGSIVVVKLGSVTHAFDFGQRLAELKVAAETRGADDSAVIKFVAPGNANLYPPGYYMLFYLNDTGKPSHAKMVKLAT
jgi:hypothetical protein